MVKKFIGDLRNEFSGYNGSKLLKDALAGVTVAAVALPLALAFAVTSGATAAAGLITAILSGIVLSLLSGASYQISGPTGAMTAILISIVARYSLEGMFITCFIAGVILLLCSIFKLGRLIDFIPVPVITGFTSGIAVVIALGQLDGFLGVKSHGDTVILKVLSYFKNGFAINLSAVMIGLFVILVMVLWPKKWGERVPSSLVAIISATILAAIFKLDVATVGEIPKTFLLEDRLSLSSLQLDKTEILRQYFINHPQSIDKYTFLRNSAFTHWVKEKCSKIC